MRFGFYCACFTYALTVGAYSTQVRSEDTLTLQDIRSAYQVNLARLNAFRIVVHIVDAPTSIQSDDINNQLQRVEEVLKVISRKSPDYEDLLLVQKNLKRRLDIIPKRTDHLFQFTTDGKSFRYCFPNATPSGTDDKAPLESSVFPNETLSEDNLIHHFSQFTVGTWSARKQDSIFKIWSGIHNGHGLGLVSPAPEPIAPARFPPIGVVRSEWSSGGAPHIFDKLILYPASEYKLEGVDNRFGKGLIKLEHISSQPEPLPLGVENTGAKKCEKLNYTTFWIDRARGYLPVRVEQGFRYVVDGTVLNEGHNSPDSVTSIEKVEKFGSSFFPIEMNTENFITYSEDSIKPPSPSEFIRGATFDFPRVVVNRESWYTKSFEHVALGEPFQFAFDFPRETRYFDKQLQRAMIVGLSAEELDAMTLAKFPPTPPKNRILHRNENTWARWWLIVLVNGIAFACIAIVLAIRHRSSRDGNSTRR